MNLFYRLSKVSNRFAKIDNTKAMDWLKPVSLNRQNIRLEPLHLKHKGDLQKSVQDGELWKLWFTSVPSPDTVEQYIDDALQNQLSGDQVPFAIIDTVTNKAIGSSRYCNIDKKNKRLEIGYTWFAKSYQRSSANTICKLLLLEHAFEHLECIAVEFRTHWHNQASRTAITRLGAKQDGVLRQHQQQNDGAYRDTVIFSILNSEWPTVKRGLLHKLSQYQ